MDPRPFGHVRIPFKRIHLELTNICDFDCVFCPKQIMRRKYGSMDADLARRLLDEIKREGLAEKVTFHVMGEPTLHRDFFAILDHARDLELPVGLTTNAGRLGGKIGQRLLDYELHQIDASLQTPDAESFALRKAGALRFEDYIEGILNFFTVYRARHATPIFKFRFLNTMFPPKSLERRHGPIRVMSTSRELRRTFAHWVRRIYARQGLDAMTTERAVSGLSRLHGWQWNVVEILPRTFFETYILADWGHAFDDRTKVRDAWGGDCFGMRDHFAVLCNGDVTLCCIDFDGRTAIGDVRESDLREVLSSEKLRRIMRGFRHMRPTLPYCKRCLGSTGLLSWVFKPIVQVAGLRLLKPYFYKTRRIYTPST